LREEVKFFQTGVALALPEETLEIAPFMEAYDESKRHIRLGRHICDLALRHVRGAWARARGATRENWGGDRKP
jgi:hypothetical protein